MAQFLGFGSGSDGVATLSGTHAPTDSSCSGSSGATSLTATNASFASGQFILIHQTRGTGAGQWEINKIASYSTGTITTVHPLSYAYADSGASQAQVLVIPQYSAVTVSGTLTAKAWDGNVGGIIPIMCSGLTTVSGTITAAGKGFRGGAGAYTTTGQSAYCGEGTAGATAAQYTANGNGGGGGYYPAGGGTCSGAGGGNGVAGGNGTNHTGGSPVAVGGEAVGAADLTTMDLGGGGGGPGRNIPGDVNTGGDGGGIVLIFSKNLTITGTISVNGSQGESGSASGQYEGAGSGAAGSFLSKTLSSVLGSGLITATGGAATTGYSGFPGGSAGAVGRIRIEACSLSGTTSPSASTSIGGHSYCGGSALVF